MSDQKKEVRGEGTEPEPFSLNSKRLCKAIEAGGEAENESSDPERMSRLLVSLKRVSLQRSVFFGQRGRVWDRIKGKDLTNDGVCSKKSFNTSDATGLNNLRTWVKK